LILKGVSPLVLDLPCLPLGWCSYFFIKSGYQNKILQIFWTNKQFHKKVAIFAHSTTTFNLGMKKGLKNQTRAQT
jgi:hypothetical protein